jgi:hypothetical protein
MVAGLNLADPRYTIKIDLRPHKKEEAQSPVEVEAKHNEEKPHTQKPQQQKQPIPNYQTFQIVPHSDVKNNKIDQFADVIAESYKEIIERWNRGNIEDPDRIFFETVMTNESFSSYISCNAELKDIVKQQARMVWKNVTLNESEGHLDKINPDKSIGFNIKLKYPFFLSLKTDRRLQEVPLPEILEMSRVMQDEDKVIVQFGFQPSESEWYKDAEQEREDFEKKPPKRWKKKEFSHSTEMKPGQYGFDFVLKVLVLSPDERRKRRISRGIIIALKQLNQDNELIDKRIKPSKMNRWIEDLQQHKIKVPFIFGKRQIITSSEIAHFVKLPQRTLQEEYSIIECITGREVSIPDTIKKGGIPIGDAVFRGKEQQVYMPIQNHDELCLPRIVIGGMGSGKTRGFGANWIVEAVNSGFGSLAIDPAKGEIGNEVEVSLPKDKVQRIRLGKVPISLDWCEVKHSARAKNRLANTVLSFFNTAADEAGAQTSRYIRAAVMGMQAGKLSEIIRIFEDTKYRSSVITKMKDSIHKMTLQDFSEMSDSKRAQVLAPILNRLDTILGDEYLAECMESDRSLDMVKLMSQKKAFIIDVPKSELGPEAVDLIVNLLSTKIDLAMTLRKESNQFPFFVLFDEPHQFLRSSKTWKAAAVESRKWRVGYVWMFHSWEQIPRELGEIIKAAGPHYHIYPSSKKTFVDLREEITPFTVEEALKIKRFHAINIIRTGGEVAKPIVAKMATPPSFKKLNEISSNVS